MAFNTKPPSQESNAETLIRLCDQMGLYLNDDASSNKTQDLIGQIANVCDTIDKINKSAEQISKGLTKAGNTLASIACGPSGGFVIPKLPTVSELIDLAWDQINDFELCNIVKNGSVDGLTAGAGQAFDQLAEELIKKPKENLSQLDKAVNNVATCLGIDTGDFSIVKEITEGVSLSMKSGDGAISALNFCVEGGFNIQKQAGLAFNGTTVASALAQSASIASNGISALASLGPAGIKDIAQMGSFFTQMGAVSLCDADLKLPELPPLFSGVMGNFYVSMMCKIAQNCPDILEESEEAVNAFIAGWSDFMPTEEDIEKIVIEGAIGEFDGFLQEMTGLTYGEAQKVLSCAKSNGLIDGLDLDAEIGDTIGDLI
jgi:hypothetical protein